MACGPRDVRGDALTLTLHLTLALTLALALTLSPTPSPSPSPNPNPTPTPAQVMAARMGPKPAAVVGRVTASWSKRLQAPISP